MDFNNLNNDLRELRRRNHALGAAAGGLVLCLILSLVAIVSVVGNEKVVLVPPAINKTFWVTKDTASGEYLEEMAGFVSWLILDVTPDTIDWKKKILLNYVGPDDSAAVKTRMDLEAARLRRISGSTSFLIQQLASSEKDQSVVLTGRLRKQINGQDVGEPETKSYLAQFRYTGGRIHVQAFKEISNGANAQTRIGSADSSGARSQ